MPHSVTCEIERAFGGICLTASGQAFEIGRDDRRRAILPPDARQALELGAVHEEFRRAAFVVDDVRFLVADAQALGRHGGGERERIRRRAGRHQKHRDIPLEDRRETGASTRGRELVGAVGRHRARIGPHQGSMTGALAPTMLSLAKFIESVSFGAATCSTRRRSCQGH